jgi:hypothetical protein
VNTRSLQMRQLLGAIPGQVDDAGRVSGRNWENTQAAKCPSAGLIPPSILSDCRTGFRRPLDLSDTELLLKSKPPRKGLVVLVGAGAERLVKATGIVGHHRFADAGARLGSTAYRASPCPSKISAVLGSRSELRAEIHCSQFVQRINIR